MTWASLLARGRDISTSSTLGRQVEMEEDTAWSVPGEVWVELLLEVGGEGRGQLQHWLDVQHRGLGGGGSADC